jgi:membrane-associated phospholipid phosphatase
MIIYDFISLSPILFFIYSIWNKEHKLTSGMIILTFIQIFIKKFTKGFYEKIFLRPDDACNCSSFNNGGFVGLEPGFPSGHVTLTTFFVNYMYFKKYPNDFFALAFLNFIPLIIGISRYEKKCHNIYQIFAGYILAVISLIFFI